MARGSDDETLEGAVAIVTGAAGGIGGEVVAQLRAAGAKVVAEDIDPAVEQLADDGIAALCADAAQGAYCATKGAIAQITRQLAIEHAADGVRVNAIAPGAVDTAFVDNALAGAPDPRAARSDIGASHPLGRMASPREIARIMVFLASPASSFMTGAVVMADGGYTAR